MTASRLRSKWEAHAVGLRLFGLAFLTLYLELSLIRFAGAELPYLGFFSNYVLTAVFLGIGMGFLAASRVGELFRLAPQLLLFLLAFVLLTPIDFTFFREAKGQMYWGHGEQAIALPLWISLPVLFGGTALLFACIAQETARCFRKYEPLTAYSIDIGGSLTGIAFFTLHSQLRLPPIAWFAVAFALVAALSPRAQRGNALLVGCGALLLIGAVRPDHYTRWSPYQKIEVRPDGPDGYQLHANGIGHQTMHRPGEKEIIYDFPYTEVAQRLGGKRYGRVLVIGAGSGTDTAYALHYGALHVDAVEIDPEILEAGKRFHPSKPYDSPAVSTYIDDGRAFLQRATEPYDLIVYALPDSLALVSNYSSIRLESFLFTVESFTQAKRLLRPDGVLILYNFYRQRWLVEKLASMLAEVFGHPPFVHIYGTEAENLMTALAIGPSLSGPPRVHDFGALDSASDDWPFLYMRQRLLPPLYVAVMAMFVGAAGVGLLLVGRKHVKGGRASGAFLLMGAAFLLLETKSVIQFSLLFGATWLVNSLVFFAILVSVLAANWTVAKVPFARPRPIVLGLLAALALNLALPAHTLLQLESTPVRYVAASAVFFSPIFFANLLFGYLFKDTPHAELAFGWNVTGTMVGAALEYTSLVLGYQKLMLVVVALYLGAIALAYAGVVTAEAGSARQPVDAEGRRGQRPERAPLDPIRRAFVTRGPSAPLVARPRGRRLGCAHARVQRRAHRIG